MPMMSTSSWIGGRDDHRRRLLQAGVDDLHAGLAAGEGEELHGVHVAVEPRLGEQHAHVLRRARDAERRRVLDLRAERRLIARPERFLERRRPLAGRAAGLRELDRRRDQVLAGDGGVLEPGERAGDRAVVAGLLPLLHVGDALRDLLRRDGVLGADARRAGEARRPRRGRRSRRRRASPCSRSAAASGPATTSAGARSTESRRRSRSAPSRR